MTTFHFFSSSLQSLQQNKLRCLLSLQGVTFAVAAVITMLAVAQGAKIETMKQLDQLGGKTLIIRHSVLTESQKISARKKLSAGLTLADAYSIQKRIPGVLHVAPVREVRAGLAASGKDDVFDILAVTPAFQYVKNLTLRKGRFICDEDMARHNLVCVLGSDVATSLGKGLGRILYLENRPYIIVGVLERRQLANAQHPALALRDFNKAIFIAHGSAPFAGQTDADEGELTEIFVKFRPDADVSVYTGAIDQTLLYNHGGFRDFQVIAPEELIRQAQKTQRMFNIVLGCIAVVSLLSGGIGIMNIMIASVTERTREIGIRRAVGATRKHIILQFVTESVTLSFIGGMIGALLGIGGALLIPPLTGWNTVVTLWSVVLALTVSICVGIFFGFYPAYRAAMSDPIKALRYE